MKDERQLASEIESAVGDPEPFAPMAFYNPDGDCIEIHLRNEPFFARILDGWFTAYYSESTREVVGGMLKGVQSNLLRRFPGLRIDVEGGRVKLALLLRAPAYESGDEVKQRTYQAVIREAEQHTITTELEPSLC